MKELYISPELKVMFFAPAERLATSFFDDFVDFDDLDPNDKGETPVISESGDLDFDWF